MDQKIQAVLEPQEKVVWQDVINRKVLAFHTIISALIIIGISFYCFSQESFSYTSNGAPASIAGATIGWIVLIAGLALTLLSFFSSFVKQYAITNKRVLVKSGIIGTDFNSIYFTEVKSVNVNVGLIDKIFSVGTINIDTGKIETVDSGSGNNRHTKTRTAYDKLQHVSQPYEVYKYFQTTLTGRQESLYSGRADQENQQAPKINQ